MQRNEADPPLHVLENISEQFRDVMNTAGLAWLSDVDPTQPDEHMLQIRLPEHESVVRSLGIARLIFRKSESAIRIVDPTINRAYSVDEYFGLYPAEADRYTQLTATKEQVMDNIHIHKHTEGLGIGEGSISAQEINQKVDPEIIRKVDELIASPRIVIDIDTDENGVMVDDDGCGDGRVTKLIRRGHEILKRSLHRAKVFGGGATMATADKIGTGKAIGMSLQSVFSAAITELRQRKVNFGAHTADHAPDGSCGCGAIDQAPKAIAFAVKYQTEITEQINGLGISTDGLDKIFDNYTAYQSEIEGQDFSGRMVAEEISEEQKVVKELGGPHIETRILLNLIRGKTVNQPLVREVSQGNIDVFAVDVWRMQDLARYLHPGDKAGETKALQSMLVYTLATAAVLTKGDLPVYLVQPADGVLTAA